MFHVERKVIGNSTFHTVTVENGERVNLPHRFGWLGTTLDVGQHAGDGDVLTLHLGDDGGASYVTPKMLRELAEGILTVVDTMENEYGA